MKNNLILVKLPVFIITIYMYIYPFQENRQFLGACKQCEILNLKNKNVLCCP